MELKGRHRRHLRALAHDRDPIVIVGKGGVTGPVVAALTEALAAHELVKVKLPQLDRDERGALADELAAGADAALISVTGRVAIYYRRHPTEPVIVLPA